MYTRALPIAAHLRPYLKPDTRVGIILGSGLGNLATRLTDVVALPYSDIPDFPVSTVEGHSGRLLFGRLAGVPVMTLQGRFHFYEGYDMADVVLPVRVMKCLGIETLILSNAAGGMNPAFRIGDLMLLRDHINLFPQHPLRGRNDERIGPRFPDMGEAYDPRLRQLALDVAASIPHIRLHEGVYVGTQGPTFETPAEYRYFRTIGGDAVGMSTVPEVIVARHAGIRCLALSIITDLGGFEVTQQVSHAEVQRIAAASEPLMTAVVEGVLSQL